ncbi:MAG TPA: tetratricopeptide repeat protein [Acidobacteriaceae bacterium]|nr:tetratricopeptide repeat protein [Acidobacteriaceae bacterium]
MPSNRIRFGPFELNPDGFELRRAGAKLRLERIPMQLLILLASRPGRLVRREEVIEAIWGKGSFLEAEAAINTAIRKLRAVLGDDAKSPRFIETVPTQGYRFIGVAAQAAPEEATALYARGLHFWNRKTPDSYVEAIRLFQKAIDIDPDYALPWLGLSKSWITLGIHGLQPAHDVYPRARAAAARALQLDPSLAEAHVALADILKGYDWDWPAAESHYREALRLDPACGLAHQWYANLLSIIGRHDEAIAQAFQARAAEPLSVGPAAFAGFTCFRARRFRQALQEAESAVTLDPNSPIANWFLGHVLEALDRFPEAAGVFSRAADQAHGAPMYLSALARASAKAGDTQRASAILATLTQTAAERYVSPLDLAIVALALGQTNAALDHLDAARQQRVMRLTELPMPTFDAIRPHPRVAALLAAMKLIPEPAAVRS